ncbi:MAG: SDR family oxidoreductase [Pseudomonadota bacterium]
MKPFQLEGSVAVLTGGAGGIGAQLAIQLASRGVDLAVIDLDGGGLKNTQKEAERYGTKTTTYVADITNSEDITRIVSMIERDYGKVNILINNAGITTMGSFQETSKQQFDRVMAVNFSGPVALTRSLLPIMMRQSKGQIVNVSSILGCVGVANQTAYCASKFALRGLSDALRLELEGNDIGVSVVYPGGVRTNIANSATIATRSNWPDDDPRAQANKLLKLDPARAAKIIVSGIEKRKRRIVVGSDAKFLSSMQRLFPESHQSILATLTKRRDSSPPN